MKTLFNLFNYPHRHNPTANTSQISGGGNSHRSIFTFLTVTLLLLTLGVGDVWAYGYYEKDGVSSHVAFQFNDNNDLSQCNLGLTQNNDVDWSATPLTQLILKEFGVYVYKNTGASENISWSKMYYRFYKSDETAPDYKTCNYTGCTNQDGAGDGYQNQYWYASGMSINLLENAGKGGEYYFDYYFYTEGAEHLSNNSTQYRIKFTVENRVFSTNYTADGKAAEWQLDKRELTDGKYVLENVNPSTTIEFKIPFKGTWTRSFTGEHIGLNTSLGNTSISDDVINNHNIQFTTPSGNTSNVSIKFTGSAVKVDCYQDRFSVSVASEPNGNVNTNLVSNIDNGAVSSGDITATPDDGYLFIGWNLPTGLSPAEGYTYKSNPIRIYASEANKTITAKFSRKWTIKGGDTASEDDDDDELGDWKVFNNLNPIATENTFEGTITLPAKTAFRFKIFDTETETWYGCGTRDHDYTFCGQTDSVEFSSTGNDGHNIMLLTGSAGTYTFGWNSRTKKLKISYPSTDHPSLNYVYMEKYGDWNSGSHSYIHYWQTGSPDVPLTTWGTDDPKITAANYFSDKSKNFYMFPALTDYPHFRVKDNVGNATNQSGHDTKDQEVTGHGGQYIYYDNDLKTWTWGTFSVHIGLNDLSATTPVVPNYLDVAFNSAVLTDLTTVPEKTNYTFGGFYTNSDGTGTQVIDDEGHWIASVENYTDELKHWIHPGCSTTLYAKWTEKFHTVAVNVSSGGYSGTPGTVQINSSDVTEVTAGEVTWSPVMTPIANPGWKFKEWQYTSSVNLDLVNYHSDYHQSGTNSMAIKASANGQTLTAVFEPRYYLVGGELVGNDDDITTSGMPGWANYDAPFIVTTSSPLLATCTRTLTNADKTYKILVRDKNDGISYGVNTDPFEVIQDGESLLFDDANCKVFLYAKGGTTFTFKITDVDASGHPYVSLDRPHQMHMGHKRVDIDGTSHNDDTGGTLTASTGGNDLENGDWYNYGANIAYTASPAIGYTAKWYTDNTYSSEFPEQPANSWTDYNVTHDENVYVRFTEKATTVTLANDGHGHVEIGSGNTVTQTTVGVTTTRELTAVPNDGYMFSSWNKSGDDIEITSTSTNPTTLSGKGAGAASEQEVRANFTYRWALKAESGNWGSSEFTIANISTDGSGNTIGSVDINLAANTDYQFTIKDKLNEDDIYKIGGTSVLYMKHDNCSNWTFGTGGDRSNCGITTAGKGTYRFSWNVTDKTISVTYPAAQLISCGAATENGGTGGSITAIKDEANNDYSNGQYISEGNTITFTATPTDGYEFVGWFSNNKYNAVPVTSENPWNFTVAEPVNVYALFAEENVYYFDGNNGTSTDWTTPTNWTRNVVPTTSSHTVRILKPVTVSNGTKVHVANVDIVTGGSFTPAGGSALTASGQLNIADGGMLIVAGSVKKVADASAMDTKTPTDYDDLNIGSTLANGNGALVIGSHDGTNKAHVAFATKAKKDDAGHNVNQFIGTPFNDENYIFYNYYGTKIYEFKAARDGNKGANNEWQRLPNDGDMTPFWGYNILTSQTTSPTLWMQGTLNSSANHVANLYYKTGDTQTENMLANSWVSPIDITKFQDSDFSANVEQTIYIYNAGTVEDEKTAGDEAADASNPGQWIVLPINSTPWTSPTVTVIPSMQAFSVYVTAASQTLTMDYNRLVYNPAVNGTATIVSNRAPRRYTEEEAPAVLKIRVSGESGYSDQIVLLSREDFTFGYDNGWDGRKIMGDDAAPQLYTITQDGKMSVDCTPLIEGTLVGFKPGEADPFYTIRFDYDGDETLYLNDLQMQLSTPIDAEYTYSFSAYANDAESRFVISATPISQTATGIDRTETVSELRKLIIHDHLYIIRQGRIYTAHGQLVK